MTAPPQHVRTEDLSAYIDEMLSEGERSAIASHLVACADCRAELGDLRATVHLLGQLPQYRPRRSFQLGMEHDTHEPQRSSIVRLVPLVRALSAAAVILFIVASGALFLGNSGDDVDDAAPPRSSVGNETGAANGASQEGETSTSGQQPAPVTEAPGDGGLIDRGAAASSGDDPLEDLTTLQEAQESAADQATRDVARVGDDTTSTASLQSRLTSEYGSAFVVGLGVVTLGLVSLWFALVRMTRPDRSSRY